MPHHLAIIQQIGADDFDSRIAGNRVGGSFQEDLNRAVRGVRFRLFTANRAIVNDRVIKMDLQCIIAHRGEMFAKSIAFGFAGLRHQIRDEDFGCARSADLFGDT